MLSSKIYSRKVSQRLIIENFVPRNYLAIRYTSLGQLCGTYLINCTVEQRLSGHQLPYMAKLSSGKTFAVGMQMTIHGKLFADAYHQVLV